MSILRTNAGVVLPNEVSTEIWANAQESSAVMQLATEIPLPGTGITVPIISADPVAGWVAEGGIKPVSDPTFGNKRISAHKVVVGVKVSDEFARDADGLYAEVVKRLFTVDGVGVGV